MQIKKPMRGKSFSASSLTLSSFLLLLIVWSLASYGNLIDGIFLPSPGKVGQALYDMARNGTLVSYAGISIYRVVIGWALSVVIAIPLGMLIVTSSIFRAIFRPLTEFARYLPVVALVPLTLLYFGIGETQKFAIIFLGTFFQLVLMVNDTVAAVDKTLINAAATLGATKRQCYTKVLLPAALPGILDALRLTMGWAWTYLVVAEMVAANAGLGYMILKSQRFLATDTIFAGLIIIGLIGLITDWLFRLVTVLIVPWHERLGD